MSLVIFTPNTVIKSADVNSNFSGLANWSLLSGVAAIIYNFVASGGVIAISSGLIGSFSNITYFINGQYYSLTGVANNTYTASKDTYVDASSSGITYTAVSNNAASPALSAGSQRLGIVVTGASSISSINQGSTAAVNPTVSSNILTVCDSLGNMIYNTNPLPDLIGYRVITSSATNSSGTTPAAVAALSCPIISPNIQRQVKVRAFSGETSATAGGAYTEISIWDGVVGSGTQLDAARETSPSGGNYGTTIAEASVTVAANSSKTYNVGLAENGGTGALNASASNPVYVEVLLQ